MIRQWAVIIALCALLGWAVYDLNGRALKYDPLGSLSDVQNTTSQQTADTAKARRNWGREITSKNLFSESRGVKPVIQAPPPMEIVQPVAPPEPRPPRPVITLNGIIKNPEGDFTAYLQIGTGSTASVMKGDTVGGISVVGITERAIVLKWDGDVFEVKLKSTSLITR